MYWWIEGPSESLSLIRICPHFHAGGPFARIIMFYRPLPEGNPAISGHVNTVRK
jgi:hypothetical protein